MRDKVRKREFRIWRILAIAITLVWLVVIWMLIDSHSNNEKAFSELELQRFEGEVNSTLATYETFSDYIFDEINQDEEIISIMNDANSASEKEKKILRGRLYDKLYSKYIRMEEHEFRQFHFHLPNTESFLRMHTPDKYGDILSDVRESVRIANKDVVKVTGFEEGKIFNGFRHVYPLQYQGKHIGSVEIDISSTSIIKVLSQLYETKDFHFIIDKSVVKENVFDDKLTNYKQSSNFEDYYIDKEVAEVTSVYNTILGDSKKMCFKDFEGKYNQQLKTKKSFSVIHKCNKKEYIIKFLSIENTKKDPIAYLISISESLGYRQITNDMYKQITLVTLLAFFIIVFGLILTYYHHEVKKNSEIDYLTKIYNRTKFYEIAEQEAKASKRYKYDSSVLFIDIDYFKRINDTYGHKWGDEVLKKLSSKILNNIRESDVFARWGGEEFVLLLPHTSKDDGIKAAEKIRSLIADSQSEELKEVTISIGVSMIYSENYNIDRAIKLADEAMYCAKRNGRNQVCST